jgi:L,D-transpeptidase catalytic domain
MKKIINQKTVIVLCIIMGFLLWLVLIVSFPKWAAEKMPLIRPGVNGKYKTMMLSQAELESYDQSLQIKFKKENNQLQKKIPRGNYLLINVSENRFQLCNSNGLIREGICSTGNFVTLVTDDSKSWTFKTPKGLFYIKDKIVDPVWKKPDWAFVEDGLPVPPANDPSRFEYGVLGDYALSLGNGYLIHGTLYKRQLGMPVTHGCIRLSDEDLEVVYNNLSVGSRVLIF